MYEREQIEQAIAALQEKLDALSVDHTPEAEARHRHRSLQPFRGQPHRSDVLPPDGLTGLMRVTLR